MLADFNINKMNSKDDILKFIDEVSENIRKILLKKKRSSVSRRYKKIS